MIESPPHAATTIPGLLDTGMKAISTTISNAFPNIPAHAVALLKTLPEKNAGTALSFRKHRLPSSGQ